MAAPALERRDLVDLGDPAMKRIPVGRRLRAWLPSVVWAAVIFSMSTDTMSAEHTGTWIEPLVRFFFPSLSPSGVQLFHEIIRKLAHLSEYFVFFVALEYGFRHGSVVRRGSVLLRALAVAALYSLTDEGHQLFVASRDATLGDCVLDTLGAAIAAAVYRVSAFVR